MIRRGGSRPRELSRSQTGPVPLESEEPRHRAVSASHVRTPEGSSRGTLITVQSRMSIRRRLSQPHSQSLDSGLGSRSDAYRILEFLHCGNVEMGSNLQYLCQNKIRYLLNLSGIERSSFRPTVQCCCSDKKFHSPKELNIDVDENSDPELIVTRFQIVNKFIADARKNGAHVLMFSPEGKNACQAMAIQYIMEYHKLSLQCALVYFRSNEPAHITDNFMEALRLWETRLQTETERDVRSAGSRRTDWMNATRPTSFDDRRVAWQ